MMAVYTVHEPPLKRYESSADPDRFVFVRDGFSFWAFLLGPLWMLRHRMWLAFIGYVAVLGALEIAFRLLGASGGVRLAVGTLLALLVGFEAGTLRRFTLARRRFANVGVVVGDDLELAERRFFDSWIKSEVPRSSPPAPGTPVVRMPASASDVIGLFPEPGAPR
jgi:hypothetical protein